MTVYFTGFSSLLTTVAALDMLFQLGSFYKGQTVMSIGFWPWMIGVALLYALDLALMRRGCAMSTPIAINVVGFLLLFAGGYLWWMQVQGITALLFAAVFYGGSVLSCFLTAKEGVRPNQTLVHTEMLILFFAIILTLEGANLPLTGADNVPLMLALGCNFVSLILARVVTENRVKVEGGRYQGILLLATVALLFFAMALVGVLAFSSTGNALITTLVGGVWQGGKAVLHAIGAVLLFLLSLLPVPDQSDAPLPPMEAQPEVAEQASETMDFSFLFPYLLAAGILLAAALLLWLLFRTRKLKLGTMQVQKVEKEKTVLVRNRLWEKLLASIRRLWEKWAFRWQCLCHWDSPQMVLLAAERWGKQHDMPRRPGDAPSAYIRRVAQVCFVAQPEQMQMTMQVCQCLDRMFYSQKPADCPKETIKALLRAFHNCDVPCNSDKVQV